MRRALALVAILATTSPHVVVMGCTVGSMSSTDSNGASVMSEHAHHGTGCDAMMTCTTAMLETDIVVDAAPPATPPLLLASPDGVEPTTAVLTADPPPPRRAA